MKIFILVILILATMVWPLFTIPLTDLYKKISARFPSDKKPRPDVDIEMPVAKQPKSPEEWASGKLTGKW